MNKNNDQQRNLAIPFQLLMHIPVPWIFILAYLVGIGLEILFPFDPRSSRVLLVSRIGGGVLFLTGAALAAWGLFVFSKAHTTTVPGKSSKKVVTSGPYRFSHNPMY